MKYLGTLPMILLIIVVIIIVIVYRSHDDTWNKIVKPRYDPQFHLTWDEYVEFWSSPTSSLPDVSSE
jgi:hypothetical protein